MSRYAVAVLVSVLMVGGATVSAAQGGVAFEGGVGMAP